MEVSAKYMKPDGGTEENSIIIKKNVMAIEDINQLAEDAAKYRDGSKADIHTVDE